MLNKLIVSSVLAAASLAAHAATDFYVVVPVKGRTGTVVPPEEITVSLSAATLSPGYAGDAYSADFKPLFFVNGGQAYVPSEVTWALASGALPGGLSLGTQGDLSGIATATGTYNFALRATYAGRSDQRDYQVAIKMPPIPSTGEWAATPSSSGMSSAQTTFAPQLPGTTKTNTFYLRNIGTVGNMAASFNLTGDTSQFKISAEPVTVSQAGVFASSCASLAGNGLSTGTCAAESVETGFYKHIQVKVSYAPTIAGNHSVNLNAVSGNGSIMPAAPLVISGSAQPVSADWSASTSQLIAPTTNYSTQSPLKSSEEKSFTLLRSGTTKLAAAFKLVGDTSHFKIVTTPVAINAVGNKVSCGAMVAADGLSTTTCTAKDGSSTYVNINVKVTYAPVSSGSHSVTLVPISGNGSMMPPPLTLTGSAVSSGTGEWSTSAGGLSAPSAASLSYGVKTAAQQVATKTFYLRNTSTVGTISSAFALAGDTAHFKLASEPMAASASTVAPCGATLAGNLLSSAECVADDIKGGVRPNIRVQVTYAPQATGSHSIQLIPTSTTGAVLPGALTLTGSAVEPAGEWSSTAGSTTALTAAYNTYATETTNVGTGTKYFYIRNKQTTGALVSGFELTGPDAQQFKITAVVAANNSGNSVSCGAVIAADGLSASPCTAKDPSSGNTYVHIRALVSYAPTVSGSHVATLAPVTDQGGLPGDIQLTGTAKFNSTGVWTGVYNGTAAPTTAQLTFAATAVGATASKTVYMYNSGTNGALSASFALTGDVSQFKIISLVKSNAVANSSSCGAVISADGQSAGECTSAVVEAGGYNRIRLGLQYAPTSPGAHSVTLTPVSSNNGTALPGSITFTGTAN